MHDALRDVRLDSPDTFLYLNQGKAPKIYLNDLYSLYSQTVKLTGELHHLKLGSDQLYLYL